MIKQILRYVGMIGNVIGMIMMPCCFPIAVSILTFFGIYTLSMGPTTLYFITGSVILMIVSWIIQARQTQSYYGLGVGIICGTLIIYYLFMGGTIWFYYIGLIGIFGVSGHQILTKQSPQNCHLCK